MGKIVSITALQMVWDPRLAFNWGWRGMGSSWLTWGATMVQSFANSTCPERAKMMTLRNEVNHITHSKSATSWVVGGNRDKLSRMRSG